MRALRRSLLATVLIISVGRVFGIDGPVRFLENRGQMAENVLFYTDIPGGTVYLHKDKLVFLFVDYGRDIQDHFYSDQTIRDPQTRVGSGIGNTIRGHIYTVSFGNISSKQVVSGSNPGKERYNYFIGTDQAKWTSGVKSFKRITYRNLYEGIDFTMYSTTEGLKYDFVIHPGADPEDIRLQYNGLDQIELRNGTLYLKTSLGEV